MDRDVARAKREHLPDGIGKAFLVVVGQTRDEVHVDIVKPGADRLIEGLDGLPGRMAAAARTLSDMVWGLMEMRVAPPALITRSFSSSSVSGRPPSTVNSRQRERSKLVRMASSSCAICALESVVGVPPPM